MGLVAEIPAQTIFYGGITLLALGLVINKLFAIHRALKSPLSSIPGPWYAPYTTMHLRYGFANGTIWKMVEKNHRKYGSIFRLGPRQIWIADKEAMHRILQTIDLPKASMYAEISRDRFSPGLFGEIRPEPHKHLKRFLNPAITINYVDNLNPFFATSIKDLISGYAAQIDAKKHQKGYLYKTDLMDDLHKLALDIMGECSFGHGFGQVNPEKKIDSDLDENVWRSIPHNIFSGMTKRYQMVYVKRLFRSLGLEMKFDWPSQMITAIKAIIDKRKNSGIDRPDLLQHLITDGEKADTRVRMNARDVTDQMSEVLLAGSETTSSTIACLFLELLRTPAAKKKLLASLPVLKPNDLIIGSKDIRTDPKFEYLDACIKEALRLHPIASEMGRRTGKEWVNLMGYNLPPGTVVSASYRNLHRNPEFWPQPMRYWPERWLEGSAREGAPEPDVRAYFPFSSGKHACIGKNFAWAEMQMVVANLFSRFDFTEVQGQDIDFRQYITMQFSKGTWKVMLTPRYHVTA
ncbi:hypothetical protein MW887_000930 [Aspergillus wentii]|nr:hypothetical protein MW887_000930 [Aspergillus wentii]